MTGARYDVRLRIRNMKLNATECPGSVSKQLTDIWSMSLKIVVGINDIFSRIDFLQLNFLLNKRILDQATW